MNTTFLMQFILIITFLAVILLAFVWACDRLQINKHAQERQEQQIKQFIKQVKKEQKAYFYNEYYYMYAQVIYDCVSASHFKMGFVKPYSPTAIMVAPEKAVGVDNEFAYFRCAFDIRSTVDDKGNITYYPVSADTVIQTIDQRLPVHCVVKGLPRVRAVQVKNRAQGTVWVVFRVKKSEII